MDKNLKDNRLIVVQGNDSELLCGRKVYTESLHFTAEVKYGTFECKAKLRYGQKEQECVATVKDDGCVLEFKDKQRAVTPGQFAVLYVGKECIGGTAIVRKE